MPVHLYNSLEMQHPQVDFEVGWKFSIACIYVRGNAAFVVVCTGRVEALHMAMGQGAFFSGMGAEDWMQRRRIDKGMNQSDMCSLW